MHTSEKQKLIRNFVIQITQHFLFESQFLIEFACFRLF